MIIELYTKNRKKPSSGTSMFKQRSTHALTSHNADEEEEEDKSISQTERQEKRKYLARAQTENSNTLDSVSGHFGSRKAL